MWHIAGETFTNRLWLGSARYPSLAILQQALQAAQVDVVTVSLRRHAPTTQQQEPFWQFLKNLNCRLLPNTAGCRTVQEAVTTAHLARELLATNWIKVEITGDDYNLQPNPFALVEACAQLIDEGFLVFPYCTDDLVLCQRLLDVGCQVLMPWAAPIGTGYGLANPLALKTLRHRFPNIPLIIDAGLGSPQDATAVMELGYDGVLLNTAVALAHDPINMAKAFALAIEGGHLAYQAGRMPKRELAEPSTPLVDVPFWQQS